MTACTQPRCTGTILDGYCELCGSPAGAPPFISAVAPASAAPSCTQPGCTGMILDGYCDVCGSPADAVPFVQTATLGAAAPSAADDSGKSEDLAKGTRNAAALEYRTRVEQAQLPDDVRVAALREVDKLERTVAQSPECVDIRIWLDTILDLPWVTKVTDWTDDIQESREVEATLQGLIKPAAAAVVEPDTAEDEPAVAEAGTAEVEPAAAEADTEAAEVEPAAAEVQESDTAEVEPAAAEADTEEGEAAEAEPASAEAEQPETEPAAAEAEQPDTAEDEPAAAEVEKAEGAPAGPRYDDTVETPAVLAVTSAGPHLGPQIPEQQAVVPVQVQPPAKKKRRSGPIALFAAALVAVLIGAFFVATRDGSVTTRSAPTATATVSTQTTKPAGTATVSTQTNKPAGTGGAGSPIQLGRLPATGTPFQAVQIQGTYRGGPDTLLRVQREEAGGVWVDFPTPTVTDASGKFTTYVELGQPGRYRLRMLDPASGVTSATFVLLIKG